MLSNLLSQLTEQGLADKYDQVLAEVPKVRADLGYPPLVTPLSQMVGTQAVMNVISGQRYKMVPKEIKDYVLGHYGQAPAKIDPEVKQTIIGDAEGNSTTCLIEPQLPGIGGKKLRTMLSLTRIYSCMPSSHNKPRII